MIEPSPLGLPLTNLASTVTPTVTIHEIDPGTYSGFALEARPVVLRGKHYLATTIQDAILTINNYFDIEGITFERCRIVVNNVHESRFAGCRFIDTPVKMLGTWDCDIDACQFLKCPENALHIDGATRQTNCLSVRHSRFENNTNVSNIFVGPKARKIDIFDVKSHGPGTAYHINVEGAEHVRILQCNITQGGFGVRLVGVRQSIIRDNHFDNLELALDVDMRGNSTFESQRFLSENSFPLDQRNKLNLNLR